MNDFFTNFHFLRPAGLILIPVVLLVWWLWKRRSDPLAAWRTQMDPELLDALTVGKPSLRQSRKLGLFASWLIAVIAIAGPTWRPAPSPFADDTSPLFILLKSSESMNSKDLAPSRLERARLEIADIVSNLQGQPLGLIAYAGTAHLVIPPTRDADVVRQMANEISPEIMPENGDRLDLALREAHRVLEESAINGSVLVVADSIDTDPELLAEAARASDLPMQILGVSLPDSSESASLASAARRTGGTLQTLQVDETDSQAIVNRAAGVPVFRAGEAENSWQEAGYFLVPIFALLALLVFRQESSGTEEST